MPNPWSCFCLQTQIDRLSRRVVMARSVPELVDRSVSDLFVEKHEYPSRSKALSDLPLRVWVMASEDGKAVKVSVGPSGNRIAVEVGNPAPVDMSEYGRTLLLPQILDENLRAQTVVEASIKPYCDGEKIMLILSDGSVLSYTCDGDDELRPSTDQSRIRDWRRISSGNFVAHWCSVPLSTCPAV